MATCRRGTARVGENLEEKAWNVATIETSILARKIANSKDFVFGGKNGEGRPVS